MRGTRRRLLLAGTTLLAPSALFAQAMDPKVAHIGWLGTGSSANAKRNLEPFRQRLRELKYVEGRDVAIEPFWAEGDAAKLAAMAREFVRRKVDVIVAGGIVGAQAAKAATSVIPIVAAAVGGDLAEEKLVESHAKPGGNLTAVAVSSPQTAIRQLEIMREILPLARHAAVLWPGPRTSGIQRQRQELEAARPPRFELTWHTANDANDLPPTFDAIRIYKPDFLLVLTSPFYFTNRRELAGFAARARLPAVYAFREFVDEGGLVSYGANIAQSYRSAADYVDRILKGARPADLPVQMSKLELAVNITTARAVGVSFPQTVLARADIIVH